MKSPNLLEKTRMQGYWLQRHRVRSSGRRSRWAGTTWVWHEAFRGGGERNIVRRQTFTRE